MRSRLFQTVFVLLLAALLVVAAGGVMAQQPAGADEEEDYVMLLPVMQRRSLVLGEIKFSSPRFTGVTTFVPELTLDLSNVAFFPQPVEMKAWHETEDEASVAWTPYAASYSVNFVPETNGVQRINVALRAANGYRHDQRIIFFYIPAGDFREVDKAGLVDLGWQLTEEELPVFVDSERLRLNSENWGCDDLPYPAVAAAALAVTLPEEGDYHLRLEGTITTYDQLPDPSEAKYDAFEVWLSGTLLGRHGNPDDPLDCGTERQVALDNAYDLQPFTGEVTLRLENHSRFDEFYNTYTDIRQVWVAAGDPPASTATISRRVAALKGGCTDCEAGPRTRD